MFLPETGAYKEVGGFIKIGQIFPEDFSWKKFWSFNRSTINYVSGY